MFFSNILKAQILFERTSDSTFKFIGEAGIVTGSYTYDQFAPDFYLEGFRLQFKKGIYYRIENEQNAFRFSIVNVGGKINHIARQYYEVKDTVNLNGKWKNTGAHLGFEHFLYQKYNFCFYAGMDAVYRKHKFNCSGSSLFNELSFQQKISSYSIGTELFFGVRFTIKEKIKVAFESAFSALIINERSNRIYSKSGLNTESNSIHHFSVEPSPLNRISLGYEF